MNYFKFTLPDYRGVALLVSLLFVFFVLMDIALYRCIQARVYTKSTSELKAPSLAEMEDHAVYSPFYGLTLKTMMLNHLNHYIIQPAAVIFNQVSHFSDVFYFVTPDMVSGFGVIFAVIAGYMMASESLFTRQLSVLVYQLRSFMDALDGVVFRARIQMRSNISTFGSLGYYMDGLCDAAGTTAFMIGVLYHLKKQKSKTKLGYSSLTKWNKEKSGVNLTPGGATYCSVWTRRCIVLKSITAVLTCFGLLLAASAFFWDMNIARYFKLLQETKPTTVLQAELQIKLFKSTPIFFLSWLWRLCNSFFFMDILMVAILVDKAWEFLTRIQFVGLIWLVTLTIITDMYFHIVKNYLDEAGSMNISLHVTNLS